MSASQTQLFWTDVPTTAPSRSVSPQRRVSRLGDPADRLVDIYLATIRLVLGAPDAQSLPVSADLHGSSFHFSALMGRTASPGSAGGEQRAVAV